MAATVQQPRRILRLPHVKAASGLDRTKIYALMQEGRFPRARRIGDHYRAGLPIVRTPAPTPALANLWLACVAHHLGVPLDHWND
jgi:hypothetical protein